MIGGVGNTLRAMAKIEPVEELEVQSDQGALLYCGYEIDRDPVPIPVRGMDWRYVHVEYDGPEDRRCGCAGSLEGCKAEVDELLLES